MEKGVTYILLSARCEMEKPKVLYHSTHDLTGDTGLKHGIVAQVRVGIFACYKAAVACRLRLSCSLQTAEQNHTTLRTFFVQLCSIYLFHFVLCWCFSHRLPPTCAIIMVAILVRQKIILFLLQFFKIVVFRRFEKHSYAIFQK